MKRQVYFLVEAVLFASLSFSLVACVSLSKEECETVDWFEYGKSDGMKGRPLERMAKYTESCAEHAVRVDDQAYTKGRAKGLTLYCTYDNGRKEGGYGGRYSGVCPEGLEADFMRGFALGQREYELRQRERELDEQRREMDERERRLRERRGAIHQGSSSYSCSSHSDCRSKGACFSGRCSNNGHACRHSLDCYSRGYCVSKYSPTDSRVAIAKWCTY